QEIRQIGLVAYQNSSRKSLLNVTAHQSHRVVGGRLFDMAANRLACLLRFQPRLLQSLENVRNPMYRSIGARGVFCPQRVNEPLYALLGLRDAEAQLSPPFSESWRWEQIEPLGRCQRFQRRAEQASHQFFADELQRSLPLLLAAAEQRVNHLE